MKIASLFILQFAFISIAANAVESGELQMKMPVCSDRDTAFAAGIVALQAGDDISDELMSKRLEAQCCAYINKRPHVLIVHRKQEEIRNDVLIHFAEVSIKRIGAIEMDQSLQKKKFWVAAPYHKEKKVGVLKLSNGKYW